MSGNPSETAAECVLEVNNLKTVFGKGDSLFTAVNDVSFKVYKGKTLCIVGESGSGKSVSARSILRILDPGGQIAGGEILYHRKDASGARRTVDLAKVDPTGREIRGIRGREVAMIFQEPMTSLSPVHTVGAQIAEVLRLHEGLSKNEVRRKVVELLKSVEIPNAEQAVDRYVFEFSGGMRQRVMIAMALACKPQVLIADEPTTALDVTTQAEILSLIKSIQEQYGMGVIFITHDMGVVAEIADEVTVMYKGRVVESGTCHQIFDAPKQDYTARLIDSVRRLEVSARAGRVVEPERRTLLKVSDLSMHYPGSSVGLGAKSQGLKALDNVSLDLFEGENLGIVGESGSGKTTLGNCLIRLLDPTSGEIIYNGSEGAIDLAKAQKPALKRVHREMRMVFQDPFASLNPRMTIAQIVGEPLQVNGLASGMELRRKVASLLEMVSLPSSVMERYPHAFSGGQRQRIGIARALALNPRLIIADEATSALDVTLRSQILDLLLDLQDRLKLSYILISHDLGVIRYFCDRVAVMYRGRIVEVGEAEKVCTNPDHDYTKALLSAAPGIHPDAKRIMARHRYVA